MFGIYVRQQRRLSGNLFGGKQGDAKGHLREKW